MNSKRNRNKGNLGNKIYKAAVSVLGTAFFVGAFTMAGRMETEAMMPPTYELTGKVIHNEFLKGNEYIISVKDMETDIVYEYYADRPRKLCSYVTLEMNNKGTLNKADDEVLDVIK